MRLFNDTPEYENEIKEVSAIFMIEEDSDNVRNRCSAIQKKYNLLLTEVVCDVLKISELLPEAYLNMIANDVRKIINDFK